MAISGGDSPKIMAEAIGSTAFSYLGGEDRISSLTSQFFGRESRAVVWVELTDPSLAAQLEAVTAFAEVRDFYFDELEVDLRFGEPLDQPEMAMAGTAVLRAV